MHGWQKSRLCVDQTDKPKISHLCGFIVEDNVLLNVSIVLGDKQV